MGEETWGIVNPSDLALSKNAVHVWRAELDGSPEDILQLAKVLSVDEQARAARFYFERDRLRFTAARGILRIILGRYLGIAPSQVEFGYEPYGKPVLATIYGEGRLCFNLSHSQDMALYAIALDRQVGIDLEYLRPLPEAEKLAERFFAEREYAAIRELPAPQQQETFFRYWTCKEAYLKAIGDGLSTPLKDVEIFLSSQPGDGNTSLLSVKGDLSASDCWFIQEFVPNPDYVAALVVAGGDLGIVLNFVGAIPPWLP